MFEKILDFVFPKKCFYCKKYGDYICKQCLEKINKNYLFKKTKNDYYDYVICGSNYKGLIRTQIHNFKFHEKSYLCHFFIKMILENKSIFNFLKNFDLITFIPMNNTKELERGYNQSKLLAKELGKILNIKVIDLLEKKYENKAQSTLNQSERRKNVKDIFKIKRHLNLKNKSIILVDDIFTTGSTVRSASKILKENKFKKICVFTIAKSEYMIYNTIKNN